MWKKTEQLQPHYKELKTIYFTKLVSLRYYPYLKYKILLIKSVDKETNHESENLKRTANERCGITCKSISVCSIKH